MLGEIKAVVSELLVDPRGEVSRRDGRRQDASSHGGERCPLSRFALSGVIGQPHLVEDGFQHGVHLCVGASDLDGGQFSERGAVDPGDQEVAGGKDDVGCGLLIDVPQRDCVA